jgi:hypothetical protein
MKSYRLHLSRTQEALRVYATNLKLFNELELLNDKEFLNTDLPLEGEESEHQFYSDVALVIIDSIADGSAKDKVVNMMRKIDLIK